MSTGHQDSPKFIIVISRNGQELKVEEVLIPSGKSNTIRNQLPGLTRHQMFFNFDLTGFTYQSKNVASDTRLEQQQLRGMGFNVDWLFQHDPESDVHKFELSSLRLMAGSHAGYQFRSSYHYLQAFRRGNTQWTLGPGLSLLQLPSYMGDRFNNRIEVLNSVSMGA